MLEVKGINIAFFGTAVQPVGCLQALRAAPVCSFAGAWAWIGAHFPLWPGSKWTQVATASFWLLPRCHPHLLSLAGQGCRVSSVGGTWVLS